MAGKRNRVSIDLGDELYLAAKKEAERKYLPLGIFLRMLIAERVALLKLEAGLREENKEV